MRKFLGILVISLVAVFCATAAYGDGSEIEFDYLGNWEDVDCKYKAVPDSVIELIPVEIPNYVKANFPSTLITKVKVKTWGYELELNTGLELEFNKAGKFLRIDD